MMTIDKSRDLLRSLLVAKGDVADFTDEESLLRDGRLDSIAIIEVVTLLEAEHGIDFGAADFDPFALTSAAGITRFVEKNGRRAA